MRMRTSISSPIERAAVEKVVAERAAHVVSASIEGETMRRTEREGPCGNVSDQGVASVARAWSSVRLFSERVGDSTRSLYSRPPTSHDVEAISPCERAHAAARQRDATQWHPETATGGSVPRGDGPRAGDAPEAVPGRPAASCGGRRFARPQDAGRVGAAPPRPGAPHRPPPVQLRAAAALPQAGRHCRRVALCAQPWRSAAAGVGVTPHRGVRTAEASGHFHHGTAAGARSAAHRPCHAGVRRQPPQGDEPGETDHRVQLGSGRRLHLALDRRAAGQRAATLRRGVRQARPLRVVHRRRQPIWRPVRHQYAPGDGHGPLRRRAVGGGPERQAAAAGPRLSGAPAGARLDRRSDGQVAFAHRQGRRRAVVVSTGVSVQRAEHQLGGHRARPRRGAAAHRSEAGAVHRSGLCVQRRRAAGDAGGDHFRWRAHLGDVRGAAPVCTQLGWPLLGVVQVPLRSGCAAAVLRHRVCGARLGLLQQHAAVRAHLERIRHGQQLLLPGEDPPTHDAVHGAFGLRFEHPTVPGSNTGGWMARDGPKMSGGIPPRPHAAGAVEKATAAPAVPDKAVAAPKPPTHADPGKTVHGSNIYQQALRNQINQAAAMDGPRKIRMEEVEKHRSEDDVWIVVKQRVYDCTHYLNDHPGGVAAIMMNAGADCTEDFEAIHSERAWNLLAAARAAAHRRARALAGERRGRGRRRRRRRRADHPGPSKVPVRAADRQGHPVAQLVPIPLRIAITETPPRPAGGQPPVRARPHRRRRGDADVHAHHRRRGARLFRPGDQGVSRQRASEIPRWRQAVAAPGPIVGRRPGGHQGPAGTFCVCRRRRYVLNGKRSVVRRFGFMCGGTGITPAYQVMQAILRERHQPPVEMWLVYANNGEEDILLREELEAWAEAHENVHVWHTLVSPPNGWKYGVGFIDEGMVREHLPPPGDDVLVGLCGPPIMIEKACVPNLEKAGYRREQYFSF
eukprot:ctg_1139.g390